MEELRPFEDLIKQIEIDGETFVPIEEIAKLATNYRPTDKGHKSMKITKSTSKQNRWFKVIFKFQSNYRITIFRINESRGLRFDLDNMKFHVYSLYENKESYWHGRSDFVYNNFQLVKSLIKWGFIEA